MLFTGKNKAHIHILYGAGFTTLMGPINVFILLRTSGPDSERLPCHCAQCHILYKTLIHFRDSPSSPWTQRRGRLYICLAVINSTFSRAPAPAIDSQHKAPIRGTFLSHCRPSDPHLLTPKTRPCSL